MINRVEILDKFSRPVHVHVSHSVSFVQLLE